MSGTGNTEEAAVVEADALRQLRATVRGVPQTAPAASGLMMGGAVRGVVTRDAVEGGVAVAAPELDSLPAGTAAATAPRPVGAAGIEAAAIDALA
ncbi:hypothetical protein, partial [Paracraurococcus ruber]